MLAAFTGSVTETQQIFSFCGFGPVALFAADRERTKRKRAKG
jgi:hypothetical protein